MNSYALGELIKVTFMPHVPIVAGAVLALLLALFFYLWIRDGLFKDLEEIPRG